MVSIVRVFRIPAKNGMQSLSRFFDRAWITLKDVLYRANSGEPILAMLCHALLGEIAMWRILSVARLEWACASGGLSRKWRKPTAETALRRREKLEQSNSSRRFESVRHVTYRCD